MNKKILDSALAHLSKDLKMKQLISKYDPPEFNSDPDHFNALCKSIIYQQLSVKAARTIYNRFASLFDKYNPKAGDVMSIDVSIIRSIGISQQKTNYIMGLAKYFLKFGYKIDFKSYTDIEVVNELIRIKGIGQWTIDMFLMFALNRSDIFPLGDLGIQKAIKILFDMKKLPSKKDMIQISKPWQPYRTVACCYLWHIVDDGIVW